MLELPSLNDRQPREIAAEAINKIAKYAGDSWTVTMVHDPGVTVLELLSYLTALQQERIDKVDTYSLHKFMALLGLKPLTATCASAQVCFKSAEDIFLPAGTRLKYQNVLYETEEGLRVLDNSIAAIGRQLPGGNVQIKAYSHKEEQRHIPVFGTPGGETAVFYLGFIKALPLKDKIHIYFDLQDEARNPLVNLSEIIPLSDVVWEYFGGPLGEESWHSVKIAVDYTKGLLFSGKLTFSLESGPHALCSEFGVPYYFLRARLVRDGYDVLPVLRHIYLNSTSLQQKATKCRSFSFTRQQAVQDGMVFDAYLAAFGKFEVFIRRQDGYLRAEEAGLEFRLERLSNGFFAIRATDTQAFFANLPDNELAEALYLIIYDPDYFRSRFLGSGDGIAKQAYLVPGLASGELICQNIKLLVKGKAGWHVWETTASLDAALPADRSFLLQDAAGCIQFGNNIHGKVPARGRDNLLFAELAVTYGALGNSRSSCLQDFAGGGFSGIEVYQFKPARSGKNEETAQQMMERVFGVVESERSCAVTADDYQRIVSKVPGLVIDYAAILPCYRPYMEKDAISQAENSVTIVVEAYGLRREHANSEAYLANVRRYVERYKLVTTQVYIMLPRYLPVDIFGEFIFMFGGIEEEAKVRAAVEEYLQSVKGCTLFYGELYFFIESLPVVKRIKYLALQVENGSANAVGDVGLPPYARVYLRDFTITASYSS